MHKPHLQMMTMQPHYNSNGMPLNIQSMMVRNGANNQNINSGLSPAPPNGICNMCQRSAATLCMRCRDFYCSPECQRLDWPRHRYICIPMPALIPATAVTLNEADIPRMQPPAIPPPLPASAAGGNTTDELRTEELMKMLAINNPQQQQHRSNQQQPMHQQQKPQQKQLSQQKPQQPNATPKPPNKKQQQQLQQQQHQLNNNKVNNGGNKQPPNKLQQQHHHSSAQDSTDQLHQPAIPLPPPTAPKDNERVIITAFRTTNRCYIRSVATNAALGEIARIFDEAGQKAPVMTMIPAQNSFALTMLSGLYVRVQIIAIKSPSLIYVHFCETGRAAQRRLCELRTIPASLIELPKYILLVTLHNVRIYSSNEKSLAYLRQFENMDSYRLRLHSSDNNGGTAELLNWQTEESLNDIVRNMCADNQPSFAGRTRKNEDMDDKASVALSHASGDEALSQAGDNEPKKSASATKPNVGDKADQSPPPMGAASAATNVPVQLQRSVSNTSIVSAMMAPRANGPPRQIQRPVMVPPFEIQQFEKCSNSFDVVVLDNSCLEFGYVGCIAANNLPQLMIVQRYLADFADADTKQPYKPKLNEYVLGRFDGEWYRAKCIEISQDDQYTVVYVDYTNERTLSAQDLRRYPSDLRTVCATNLCLIGGLPATLSAEDVTYLKERLVQHMPFNVDKVTAVEEGIVVIECNKQLPRFFNAK